MFEPLFAGEGLTILSKWTLVAAPGLRIVLILLMAWAANLFSHRLIRGVRLYVSRSMQEAEEANRIATIGQVLRYVTSVVITLLAGILILGEMGISVAPILGAAGVAGVAFGFGAQSLVKDYFNGFFFLLENQIRQGDMVEVGGKTGVVEEVTLRYVRLRDYGGNVHFVPNGVITTVTNMTKEFSFAVVDVGVAYRENLDEAMSVMRAVGEGMRADPVFGPKIRESVEMAGVENWADSAVVLRCRFKVVPMEQANVRREFLRRLKSEFEARRIEIPFPHITVYAGEPKEGEPAPFRLKMDKAGGAQ